MIPLGEIEKIEKSEDIIKILCKYVKDNFDKFGHQGKGNDWWWNTLCFGGSWSPFVETCFICYEEKNQYQIHHSYTHSNIKDYMRIVHKKEYDTPEHQKYHIDISDINLLDNDKYILSLEHSEDAPEQDEIKRIIRELDYNPIEDEDVEGKTARKQLCAVRDEINKLKGIKSRFKVLISRPRRFKKIKENGIWRDTPNYLDSVNYFKKRIEEDLKKDAASFDDNETWIIILIAPDPDAPRSNTVKPDKIIFHCSQWIGKNEGGELSEIDEKHDRYYIPIKQVTTNWLVCNKWIVNKPDC